MVLIIPILLNGFVIVFSQPVKTTFCYDNYNDINDFSPQNKIHFKKLCTDIINMIKQVTNSTLSSDIKTTELQLKPEIILCNCLLQKTKIYYAMKKNGFILLKWIEFNYCGSDNPVIVLQNMKGQTLKQIPVVNETGELRKRMTTHNLASGVYLLTIQGDEVFPVKMVMIDN